MSPIREEALFALALEKPATESDAFLKAVCRDDKVVVYVAEQTEQVRRRVALKVIKLGMAKAGAVR